MILIDLKEQYRLEVKCFCRNVLSKKGFIFSDSGFKRYDIYSDEFVDVDCEAVREIIEEHCVNWYDFDVMEIIFPQDDFPYLLNHQLNSYKQYTPLLKEMKPISQVNNMRKKILKESSKIRKQISKTKSSNDVLLFLLDELVFMDDGIFYRYDKSSKMFEDVSSKVIADMVSNQFNESDVHFSEAELVPHLPTSDLIPGYNHQIQIYNEVGKLEEDFHLVDGVIHSFQ